MLGLSLMLFNFIFMMMVIHIGDELIPCTRNS